MAVTRTKLGVLSVRLPNSIRSRLMRIRQRQKSSRPIFTLYWTPERPAAVPRNWPDFLYRLTPFTATGKEG